MKLETLTSLHIGSGDMLQKDSDFVFGKDAKEQSVVYVINPRKVLALIGEENVDAWTVAIENGRSTEDIVKPVCPQSNNYRLFVAHHRHENVAPSTADKGVYPRRI